MTRKSKELTIGYLRRTASMLLFSAGANNEVKRGVRAMRDLLITGVRIRRKYQKIAAEGRS